MIDVKGYEGLYAVTSCGRVWSYRGKKFLKPYEGIRGYLRVWLSKNNVRWQPKIHRLVAEAYIQNPENLKQVNHKDENKQNNSVNNLEWCTNHYNSHYGTRKERIGVANKNHPNLSKKVFCVELDKTFESISEANRKTGISVSQISRCCNGIYKSAGKLHWKYA